jgi:Transmembrane domain of unknown function (DUF3566)
MSTRESGSDTWPRFAAFPRDNLDLGNATEEGDVNHEPEPPSWMSGAAAVGTGAGPPSEDQETNEDRNGQAFHPDVGVADEDDAPKFSEEPSDTEFGELPADEPGFAAPGGPPGFGQAPAPAPRFGAAPDTDPFGASRSADPGFGSRADQGFGSRAETAAGFEPGPQAHFDGSYPGQYGGTYQGGYSPPPGGGYSPAQGDGYSPAQGDGSFAGPDGSFGGGPEGSFRSSDGSFAGPDGPYGGGPEGSFGGPEGSFGGPDGRYGAGPATGVLYGTAAAGAGYVAGHENGAGFQDQAPPLPGQYPPPPVKQQRRSKAKASIPSPWRRRKSRRAARGGRQAQLTLARLEPWSVMKFSFVISLVAFIVLFVAVAVLYAVLSGLGVFDALQRTIESITSSQSATGFNLHNYLSASRVLGYTGLLGAVNVVLITALSTVGAVLYNITADLAGGVEVTLKETD